MTIATNVQRRHPRRREKFWMVTFADRMPDYYYELPMYFPTKRQANEYLAKLQSQPEDYGFAEDESFAVKVSDIPWDDIEWPWSDGSQW